jgi:ribonucleoside-diphosphate reductase alpha chain
LEVYVNKFSHTRFEPMGYTKNPDIRIAKSLVDYIFRWLGITFLPGYREANKLLQGPAEEPAKGGVGDAEKEFGPAAKMAGGPSLGPGSAAASSTARPKGHSPNGANGSNGGSTATHGHGNGSVRRVASGPAVAASGEGPAVNPTSEAAALGTLSDQFAAFQADAPICDNCGSITVRNGNCYLCYVCGSSLGCS